MLSTTFLGYLELTFSQLTKLTFEKHAYIESMFYEMTTNQISSAQFGKIPPGECYKKIIDVSFTYFIKTWEMDVAMLVCMSNIQRLKGAIPKVHHNVGYQKKE